MARRTLGPSDVLEILARVKTEGSLDPLTSQMGSLSMTAQRVQRMLSRFTGEVGRMFDQLITASKQMSTNLRFDRVATEMGVSTVEYLDHLRDLSAGTVSDTQLMADAIEAFQKDGAASLADFELQLEITQLRMTETERAFARLTGSTAGTTDAIKASIADGLRPYVGLLTAILEKIGLVNEEFNIFQTAQADIIEFTSMLDSLIVQQLSFDEARIVAAAASENFRIALRREQEQMSENVFAAEELERALESQQQARRDLTREVERQTQAEATHAERLLAIDEDLITRREELRQKYTERVAAEEENDNRSRQDQYLGYTRRLEDIEHAYQQRLADIKAGSDDDIEDAVRRRDARAILQVLRQRQRSLNDATRDRNRERQSANTNYERQRADAEASHIQRLADLRAANERELVETVTAAGRRRTALLASYAQEQADLARHIASLRLIASGASRMYGGGTGAQAPSSAYRFYGGHVVPRQRGGVEETTTPTTFMTSEFGQREGVVTVPGGLKNLPNMLGNLGQGKEQKVKVIIELSGEEAIKSMVRDVLVQEVYN